MMYFIEAGLSLLSLEPRLSFENVVFHLVSRILGQSEKLRFSLRTPKLKEYGNICFSVHCNMFKRARAKINPRDWSIFGNFVMFAIEHCPH